MVYLSLSPPSIFHIHMSDHAIARCIAACLLLFVGHTALAAPSAADRADAIARNAMRTHQIPGVCLGVMRDGRLIKATGYGYANVELKVPLSPASIFQSGSVAKQFTAAAIMMLVQEGKLGIDDKVVKYFPE